MNATQTLADKIYADLKLADRMTPGRTPWQTLRKRAEAIAAEQADGSYLAEKVVYGGEVTTRGAMIADLQQTAASMSDSPAEQQAFVSRYLQGFDRGMVARALYDFGEVSVANRNLSRVW